MTESHAPSTLRPCPTCGTMCERMKVYRCGRCGLASTYCKCEQPIETLRPVAHAEPGEPVTGKLINELSADWVRIQRMGPEQYMAATMGFIKRLLGIVARAEPGEGAAPSDEECGQIGYQTIGEFNDFHDAAAELERTGVSHDYERARRELIRAVVVIARAAPREADAPRPDNGGGSVVRKSSTPANHSGSRDTPEPFDSTHLRPDVIVRGQRWDYLDWLRAPKYQGGHDADAPDTELVRAADYIQKLEAAYGTEREMHNAWRKRAEEADSRLGEADAAGPLPSESDLDLLAFRVRQSDLTDWNDGVVMSIGQQKQLIAAARIGVRALLPAAPQQSESVDYLAALAAETLNHASALVAELVRVRASRPVSEEEGK